MFHMLQRMIAVEVPQLLSGLALPDLIGKESGYSRLVGAWSFSYGGRGETCVRGGVMA